MTSSAKTPTIVGTRGSLTQTASGGIRGPIFQFSMQEHVFTLIDYQFEIVWAIVVTFMVFVVNYFIIVELSAKNAFHNQTMFHNSFAVILQYLYVAVSIFCSTSLPVRRFPIFSDYIAQRFSRAGVGAESSFSGPCIAESKLATGFAYIRKRHNEILTYSYLQMQEFFMRCG
jgi:hypothetical protein